MGPSNNGFGSFGNSAISSGGGGDIIIAGSNDKKSGKKKWMIGVVVFCVLIIAAVVLCVVVSMDKTSKVLSAYDSYAEYMIYGTEGENDINDETFDTLFYQYALAEEVNNSPSEESEEYFKTLIGKLEKLQEYVNNSSKLKNTDLPNILNEQKGFLEFYILSSQVLSSNLIMNDYLDGGDYEVLEKVKTIVEDSRENNAILNYSAGVLGSYIESEIEKYAALDGLGCISADGVNSGCVYGLPESSIAPLLEVEFGYDSAYEEKEYIASQLKGGLMAIYKEINEVDDDE